MNSIRTFLCVLLPLLVARPLLAADAASAPSLGSQSAEAHRGERLVAIGGCHDCHTPLKVGPDDRLVPDMTRMLSGHPERFEVPRSSRLPVLWGMVAGSLRTTFSGPWGISFATNLTPDRETGLGDWTEQQFIDAMRTGQHRGRGRPILPPMPVAQHTDAELKAIWVYLRSIPAIRNQVPPPQLPPSAAPGEVSRGPNAPVEP